MAKAVGIADTNLLSKCSFVLSKGRSADQLTRIGQETQGNQAVPKRCRSAKERYMTSGAEICGSMLSFGCLLDNNASHEGTLLEVVVKPAAQQDGCFNRQPLPDSAGELAATAAGFKDAELQLARRGIVVAIQLLYFTPPLGFEVNKPHVLLLHPA